MAEGKVSDAVGEKAAGAEGGRKPSSNYNYDEAVLKVQEWNEALKCMFCCFFKHTAALLTFVQAPSRPSKHSGRNHSRTYRPHSPTIQPPADIPASTPMTSLLPVSTSAGSHPSSSGSSAWRNGSVPNIKATGINLVEKIQPLSFVLQIPEEQTDNWDDDFEEEISLTKIQGYS